MTPAHLTFDAVSYRYPDGTRALDSCSLSINRGTRTAVLGANGAGKTTMFLHLNGLLRPTVGTVCLEGTPLDYSRAGMRRVRSRVGLVFQNPDSQLFSASVREDVSFGPMNLGLADAEVRTRVEEALLAVGMTESADKPVHNLSYGQKKRVCIAGVLAMQPEVLILDEPMAGLDAAMQTELTNILDQLHADGMTIIIATHDMDFAYQWSDSLIVLSAGTCAASWEARDLHTHLYDLAAFGLGIPQVAELQQALAEAGVFQSDSPPLRSHGELVRHIQIGRTVPTFSL
jgi:cobalt/nickel transport system ATP-binding protein